MRSILGYVITELTDVHWEANGLLDINRNPRVFHDRFAEINTDTVIVPQIAHHAIYSGDSVPLNLKVATGGKAVPAGATLTWSVDGASRNSRRPADGRPGGRRSRHHLGQALRRRSRRDHCPKARGRRQGAGQERDRGFGLRASAAAGPARLSRQPTPNSLRFAKGLGYIVADAASADLILTHALSAG